MRLFIISILFLSVYSLHGQGMLTVPAYKYVVQPFGGPLDFGTDPIPSAGTRIPFPQMVTNDAFEEFQPHFTMVGPGAPWTVTNDEIEVPPGNQLQVFSKVDNTSPINWFRVIYTVRIPVGAKLFLSGDISNYTIFQQDANLDIVPNETNAANNDVISTGGDGIFRFMANATQVFGSFVGHGTSTASFFITEITFDTSVTGEFTF